MPLPVFLHIEAMPNPNEMGAMHAYLHQVPTILQEYGGVPIATYDVERALDEYERPGVFVVISFPTRESIMDFFNAPAYKAIVPLREKGFRHIRFYITSERI